VRPQIGEREEGFAKDVDHTVIYGITKDVDYTAEWNEGLYSS
jgi:hypothetical protein